MTNTELIEKFYHSFSSGNADGMIACYHEDVEFQDPAFGKLKGDRAKYMWRMLLSDKRSELKLKYSDIVATGDKGSARWTATYYFGKKRRKVINNVQATFEFKDGKIVRHTDTFDLWKWTQQAMGLNGYLLGWSSYMQHQIQKRTNHSLDAFMLKYKS